jgi:hypothetical protein
MKDTPQTTVSQTKEDKSYLSNNDAVDIEGEKSLGVKRVEALSAQLSKSERIVLFISIFFIAYCYGLDILLRSATYQVCTICILLVTQSLTNISPWQLLHLGNTVKRRLLRSFGLSLLLQHR